MPLRSLPQKRKSHRQHKSALPHVMTFNISFIQGMTMDLKQKTAVLFIMNSVLTIEKSMAVILLFPLVGNPFSDKERFRSSRNDGNKDLKQLPRSLEIHSKY